MIIDSFKEFDEWDDVEQIIYIHVKFIKHIDFNNALVTDYFEFKCGKVVTLGCRFLNNFTLIKGNCYILKWNPKLYSYEIMWCTNNNDPLTE